jgi:F420-non-reducing hydrogenase iron-sulfur subunit
MRLAYSPSIKIIPVPCTGKVDAIHMLRAFEKGADGVYALGCIEGECHYNHGNLRAKKRTEQVAALLDKVGIERDRVAMFNLSSSQAQRFVEIAVEMTARILDLGPNPIKTAKKKRVA